jgi:hypothetical protein
MRLRAEVLTAAVAVAVAATAAGCGVATATAPAVAAPPGAAAGSTDRETALAALAALAVKGRAPLTGYSRAQFGPAWYDEDHNGCDTRDDILRRDLRHERLRAGGCIVQSGSYLEPYSGRPLTFKRGVRTSDAVQIDHVVALADAWQTGARTMSAATRRAYANDPLVLLAVSGPLNEQKGDGDAASWLPPDKAFRCTYVARQVAIKVRYHLWVTTPEKAAIARILSRCPGQQLPTAAQVRVPPLGASGD